MRLRLYHPRPKKGRIEPVLVLALLLLVAILAFSLWGELTHAFRLPSMSEEHEDLKDWVEQVRASDVQSSRSRREPARRKASEDVHPMNTDNLMDMEETVYPSFDTPGYAWWDWDAPDWWNNPAGEYGTRPYTFPWDADPGAGGAWRVCRPEVGGYYVDCAETEQWDIDQPSSDIIELIAFGGPGILLAVNNDYIKFQAMAGADDGQQIQIAYEQTPVVGGVYYPSFTCSKTYHIQCEDCECVGVAPDIYGDSTTIDRPGGADPSVDLWVGTGFACGPFTWSVSGTGFHFGSTSGPTTGETEEELEIITLYTDATACGAAEITVTDSCGVTTTTYVRCTEGRWLTCNSGAIGGCTPTGAGYLYIYFDNPVCRAGFNCASSGGSTSCIGFTGSEGCCQRCYGNVACPYEVCASGKACNRVADGWTCP